MVNQNSNKKILIIQGNPDKTSFCDALAESYKNFNHLDYAKHKDHTMYDFYCGKKR